MAGGMGNCMAEPRRLTGLRIIVCVLLCSTVAAAADPATRCKTGKMGVAGAYDLCLLQTTASATLAGGVPDPTRCDATFGTKWLQAETRAAGACPTTNDSATIASQVSADVNAIIAALMPSTTTSRCTADKLAAAGKNHKLVSVVNVVS